MFEMKIKIDSGFVLKTILLISVSFSFFSTFYGFGVYISSMLIIMITLLSCRYLKRNDVVLAASVTVTLVLGSLCSKILGGGANNNYLYTIFYGLSVVAFLTLSNSTFQFDSDGLKKIYKIYVLFAFFACAWNIAINYRSFGSISLNVYDSYQIAFAAFYHNRNTFGSMMCICSVPCIYLYLSTQKKRWILVYLLIAINIVFTFSRSSILFLIVFETTLILQRVCRGRGKWKWIVLLILLACVLLYVSDVFIDYIEKFIIRNDSNLAGRERYWSMGFELFKKSPFFGMGSNCGEIYLASFSNKRIVTSFHSTFIEILACGGAGFLLFHIFILKRIFQQYRIIRGLDLLFAQIMISGIIAFLIQGCFETTILFSIGDKGEISTILFFVIPMLYRPDYSK